MTPEMAGALIAFAGFIVVALTAILGGMAFVHRRVAAVRTELGQVQIAVARLEGPPRGLLLQP